MIDCDEGAELIYGFKKKISNDEFRKRIEDNTFLDVVNHVKVKKGEFFFIESGTLHAIGKGILLAEIQQNSNTTYRVYDYNRLGADGKPRELHTEKALDVTKCEPPKNNGVMPPVVKKDGYDEKTPYFVRTVLGQRRYRKQKLFLRSRQQFVCIHSRYRRQRLFDLRKRNISVVQRRQLFYKCR